MTAHGCRVDRSHETGSLVVCTCGFVLGPFMDHDRAAEVARSHRRIHGIEQANAAQRERRSSR